MRLPSFSDLRRLSTVSTATSGPPVAIVFCATCGCHYSAGVCGRDADHPVVTPRFRLPGEKLNDHLQRLKTR